jgi:hypothetical protein
MTGLALHRLVIPAIMAAADFSQPIPAPYDAGSTRQVDRPPRIRHATFPLMPAAYTAMLSEQVSDFEDIGLLIQHDHLLGDFCSSGQRFVTPWRDFLQIPPQRGHPCRPANTSPCRVCRGLDFDIYPRRSKILEFILD